MSAKRKVDRGRSRLLSDEQLIEIVKKVKNGNTYKELSTEYNTSSATLCRNVNRYINNKLSEVEKQEFTQAKNKQPNDYYSDLRRQLLKWAQDQQMSGNTIYSTQLRTTALEL